MKIYCPTCRATDQDECATPTGRDHPARRRLIYAQTEHDRPGEKCGAGWKALAYHSDWKHLCTLTPGHFGKHLCRCGRHPSPAAPVSEPSGAGARAHDPYRGAPMTRRFTVRGRDVRDAETDQVALMPDRQTAVAAARLMNATPACAPDYQWVTEHTDGIK